jgi:hypothetical protein
MAWGFCEETGGYGLAGFALERYQQITYSTPDGMGWGWGGCPASLGHHAMTGVFFD